MAEMTPEGYEEYARRHGFCCFAGWVTEQTAGMTGDDCPEHGTSEFAVLARASSDAMRAWEDKRRAHLEAMNDRARAQRLAFQDTWDRVFGQGIEVDFKDVGIRTDVEPGDGS